MAAYAYLYRSFFQVLFLLVFSRQFASVKGASSRHQNKLHQMRGHPNDESDVLLADLDDIRSGSPLGPGNSIEYGEPCVKINPSACKHFPEVGCVWVEESIYICRCDFQHTFNDTLLVCVPNVFTPCTHFNESIECGPNMECVPDSINNDASKTFCRCKKGYSIVNNEEGIPALCNKSSGTSNENDDENLNVSNQAFVLKVWKILYSLTLLPITNQCNYLVNSKLFLQ